MECSYKFRLYPNMEQENFILRTFGCCRYVYNHYLGCCRYVYNHYLALRKQHYEQTGGTLGYVGCAKDLTVLKQQPGTAWLRDADSTALQSGYQRPGSAGMGLPSVRYSARPKHQCYVQYPPERTASACTADCMMQGNRR